MKYTMAQQWLEKDWGVQWMMSVLLREQIFNLVLQRTSHCTRSHFLTSHCTRSHTSFRFLTSHWTRSNITLYKITFLNITLYKITCHNITLYKITFLNITHILSFPFPNHDFYWFVIIVCEDQFFSGTKNLSESFGSKSERRI